MRCLSGRQPWFWALFHGKNIENRKRPTQYRGKLLIHASKTVYSRYEWTTVEDFCCERGLVVPAKNKLTFGAIIGVVDLVDCQWETSGLWGIPNQYHYYLQNSKMFPVPVHCRGQLSMWDIPQINDAMCERLTLGTADVSALQDAIRGMKRKYQQLSLL